ncbi:MAG: hypothetical protein SNF33_05115 [Candidatus Algichlamydia australiensis]|nr:hypothetical protein [Chlamydiales bacterium]
MAHKVPHSTFEEYYRKMGSTASSHPSNLWNSENDKAYQRECNDVMGAYALHKLKSLGIGTGSAAFYAGSVIPNPWQIPIALSMPFANDLFSQLQSNIDTKLIFDMQNAFAGTTRALKNQNPEFYQNFCGLEPKDRLQFLKDQNLVDLEEANPTTKKIAERIIEHANLDENSLPSSGPNSVTFNESVRKCSDAFNGEKENAANIANALADVSSSMESLKGQHEALKKEINKVKESNLSEKEKLQAIRKKIVEQKINEETRQNIQNNLEITAEAIKTTLIAAQTFGIKVPRRVQKGLQAGMLLAQAGMGIASATGTSGVNAMGYMQAAQSLLGICALFGRQQEDPAAQRHAMIMDAFNQISQQISEGFGALGQNQQQILANQRAMGQYLSEMRQENRSNFQNLFENQSHILESVNELRKSEMENHAFVMRALSIHTQFFIRYSEGINALLWERAHTSKDALEDLLKNPNHYGYIPDQNRFQSLEKAREFLNTSSALGSGLAKVRYNFMGAHDTRASALHLIESAEQAEKAHDFPLLIEYIQDKFDQNSTSKLIAMLVNVCTTGKEIEALSQVQEPENFSKQILSITQRATFHGTPLELVDKLFFIKALKTWAQVAEKFHYLLELYKDPESNTLYSIEEFDNLKTLNGKGYEMLKGALDFVGLAIAQQNLLSGHLLLPKLSEDLFKKPSSLEEIFIRHPLIVHNLVIYQFSRTPEARLEYMTSWAHPEPEALKKTLGNHFSVVGDEKKWKLQVRDKEIPLPNSNEVSKGQLAHTLELEELFALHQNLSKEAARYEIASRLRLNPNPALLAIHEGRAKFQITGGKA